jgi:hypothetical protein
MTHERFHVNRLEAPHHPQHSEDQRIEQGDPQPFIECVQTIYPIKGRSTPVTPGTSIELEVPDMYGRPWARIWEQYWEEGMERPQEDDVFSFE